MTREPLFKLEARALEDPAAASECAKRYTTEKASDKTDAHRSRLERMWLRGLSGDPNPMRHARGGNFAAPLRSAWAAGAALRRLLVTGKAGVV